VLPQWQLHPQVFRVWNWRVPEPGQLPMPVLLHPVETDTSMAFPVRAWHHAGVYTDTVLSTCSPDTASITADPCIESYQSSRMALVSELRSPCPGSCAAKHPLRGSGEAARSSITTMGSTPALADTPATWT